MRIALVSDSYLPVLGGIELHVRDLATRLAGRGHSVDIVTRTPEGGATASAGAGCGVRVHRVTRPQRDLAEFLSGADVVHAHSSVFSPLAWRAAATAREFGVPALLTVHSMVPHGAAVPMALALRTATTRGLQWTAVSEAVAAPVSRTVGRPVQVLHNGIDPEPWRTGPNPEPLNPESPNPGTFTVVSALRFAPRKRPFALVRMLRDLHRALPADVDLRAVLVGDGPLVPATRRRLEQAGLAERVHLAGRVERPQVREILSAGDVYLAPARLESFGLAALEARCVGLPVVAMASSGVREFVRHDVEGLLALDDADAVRHLHDLATDQGRRGRIREHNRVTTPAATWPRTLASTLAQYRRAAQAAGVSVESWGIGPGTGSAGTTLEHTSV